MTCPYCQRRVVDQFNPAGRCQVQEGDVSVCAACSGVCVLHGGVLCRPTPEEFQTVQKNPQICSAVAGIIRGLARARHLRS